MAIRGSCYLSLGLLLLTLLGLQPSFGQEGPVITRVEEDWQIVVGLPNPEETAPQISIVVSPFGDLNQNYAVLEMNHLSLPEFRPGGLQLQSWIGDNNQAACQHSSANSLAIDSEQISFTFAVTVNGGALKYEVLNGTSTTWGAFGSGLKLTEGVGFASLSAYRPETTVAHSRVGFAGNRVKNMTLKAVRYYSNGALVKTDAVARLVHQFDPSSFESVGE